MRQTREAVLKICLSSIIFWRKRRPLDFAIRSGLIQKEQLFTPEQLTEIYRCCADSVDGDFFELTGEQEKMIRSVQQQIEECVPDLDERIRQQEEALEQATQEQTM